MVFVLTAAQRSEYLRNGDEHLVIAPIGHDDDDDWSYSIAVGFSPMGGGDSEFFFYVVGVDGDTQSEEVFWSGKRTRFLSGAIRQNVLKIVVSATESLLAEVCPDQVVMMTHDEDPPTRALRKYDLICDAFRRSGYTLSSPSQAYGRWVWKMTCRSQSTRT